MSLQGFQHIALFTSDLDETIRFWTQVMHAKLVRAAREEGEPGLRHYYFDLGGAQIVFYEFPAQKKEDLSFGWMHHVALKAGSLEALELLRAHIETCGVPVSEVREQDYAKYILLHDPNGILIKVLFPTRPFGPGDLKLDPKPAMALKEITADDIN